MSNSNQADKDSAQSSVEEVEARFDVLKHCKNSVRYQPSDADAMEVSNAFYLMNDSFAALGKPDSITITIRPIIRL